MSTVTASPLRKWVARSRAWIALVVLAPFAYAALVSSPNVIEGNWPDLFCDVLAWPLFVAGGAIRWWATLYIGSRKSITLTTEGPYSICRNPLYLGTFLMTLSVAMFLESLTFAVGLMIASAIYLATTVPVEEKKLRALFGPAFDEYCRQVPRFVPRFRRFHTPEIIEVNTRGLAAETLRAARWVWLPLLCELMTHLRAESWWPHLLDLP